MLNLLAVFDLAKPERSARLREARMAALLLLGAGHPHPLSQSRSLTEGNVNEFAEAPA